MADGSIPSTECRCRTRSARTRRRDVKCRAHTRPQGRRGLQRAGGPRRSGLWSLGAQGLPRTNRCRHCALPFCGPCPAAIHTPCSRDILTCSVAFPLSRTVLHGSPGPRQCTTRRSERMFERASQRSLWLFGCLDASEAHTGLVRTASLQLCVLSVSPCYKIIWYSSILLPSFNPLPER